MIIDLPNTQTNLITRRLRELREERGEVATGRVLTFIVVVSSSECLDEVISATHDASREHPARVIVLVSHKDAAETRLDAEIRLGGDAGASEIIVMHLHRELSAQRASVVTPLLLPDTPVVAWWPFDAPRNPSADPIGALATRRITDSFSDADPDAIYRRRMTYSPGDTDLVWSRITLWRGLLASTLDQPPFEDVLSVELYGPAGEPSVDIAAGWLAERLDVPVTRHDASLPTADSISAATRTAASETLTDGSAGDDNQRDDAAGGSATASAVDVTVDVDEHPHRPGESEELIPIHRAVLRRDNSSIDVEALNPTTVRITVDGAGGETKTSLVTLSRRADGDCLAEELRHLDPDHSFGQALRGLVRVNRPGHRGRLSAAMRSSTYFDGPDSDALYGQASMR